MTVGIVLIVMYLLYYKGVFSQSKADIAKIDKELSGSNMPEFTFSNPKKDVK